MNVNLTFPLLFSLPHPTDRLADLRVRTQLCQSLVPLEQHQGSSKGKMTILNFSFCTF